MKKTLLKSIFVLLALVPGLAFASPESENRWFLSHQNNVLHAVKDYLETYTLRPYLTEAPMDFVLGGMTPTVYDNEAFFSKFIFGTISQGARTYHAMFSISKDKATYEVSAYLMFLSNAHPISEVLFSDIANAIFVNSAHTSRIPNHANLFIEKLRTTYSGSTEQAWHFYSRTSKYTINVTLTPDGQGGTYFNIR